METVAEAALSAWSAISAFFAWLGIHPTPQDFVKAVILTVFVLAILIIVGDVYRGEIQNRMHRIILAPSAKGAALPPDQRTEFEARRRLRKEKDIVCHVPQHLIPLTLNDIYSNIILYFRYRDCAGKLRTKKIETYRIRFHVRKVSNPHALAAGHEGDHKYNPEEEDRFTEEDNVTIITMAPSRVDYVDIGKIEPILAAEMKRYEAMQNNGVAQALAGIKNGNVCQPQPLGLAAKFHFPINPHFLLYKHPDTNVRTTAWLTVLTSVFALFMQLIYSSGTDSATASPVSDPPAVVRSVTAN